MTRPCFVTINYQALLHNLAIVRRLAPSSQVMAMVKADAYGHGLSVVAEKLTTVDAFGVACIEEALVIRQYHPNVRIVLMEGFFEASELSSIVEHKLECVVHTTWQIDVLEKQCLATAIPVWLKVNTGMHRLGVPLVGAVQLWNKLQQNPNVQKNPKLMTHLAQADAPTKEATQQQLDRFNLIREDIHAQYSIANSAGILHWPETHLDWVRPGIILYGISPFADKTAADFNLRPVMTLHSKIISLQDCQVGDKVGYGGEWVCQKPTRVGIIAIGYGDGYPRHAKSETPVLVNDQLVNLIGRVSMDMIAVDLSHQPHCKIGDPVVLWGEGLAIERVASCADTIPYELVCNITPRVRRTVMDDSACSP